jgi:hypothetical protein
MRYFLADRIRIFGHCISSIGCKLAGGHIKQDGRWQAYCLLCGRRVYGD